MKSSPTNVLCSSSLEFVKVCIICKPSLPKQFFFIGTFSSSVNSYFYICCMLLTFISKPSNSTYLPGAFQLKDSCFRIGLPCLCLHASPKLGGSAPDVDSVSALLIIIITVVASWIATCVSAVWIPSDSSISPWISIIFFTSIGPTISAF